MASFKVGEAPWEKKGAQASAPAKSYKVGEAPWEKAPQTSLWDDTKSAAGTAADYGLRALDYGGGLSRTAAAAAVSPFTPNGQVVDEATVMSALKGKAPNTAEYMDRMGVPKGANVDLPFVGNVSARGVGGFIGDVALDPLTYVSLGAKPAATAAGRAVESAGDSLYKSGFKTVDAKLAGKGVEPLSEVMINNGRPWGTASTMSDAVDKLTAQKLAERQAVYEAVNKSGGKVDLIRAMEPAVEKGKDILRVDPNAGAQVSAMEDWLLNYGKQGDQVPLSVASEYKTRLYNASLPTNAYDGVGRALPVASDMKKQFARGLKEQIEQAAEKSVPGTGAQITGLNNEMGVLIAAQKKALPTEVLKSANKNGITSFDGMIAGATAHNPLTAIPMYVAKKGVDAFNTTSGRTGAGNALSALGRSGVVDPAVRRTLIDMNQDKPSPWEKMKEKKK